MHRRSVYFLVVAVAVLVAVGCVMLFSTSAFALDSRGNPHFFIKRQLAWLAMGFFICVLAANVNYHVWQRTWWLWFGASVVLLVLCFVPPIGQRINGSARWIDLGFASFQPSELAKFAAVTALAWWFAREDVDERSFLRGFIFPMLGVGVLMGLIAPEVDMGSTALIGATMFTVMFVAGSRVRYLAVVVLVGVIAFSYAITHMPERLGRVLAFWYPEQYPADFYQQEQALIALGSGGIEGLGLGNGRQKMAYLPFAHTDFIFPMIGEELGLWCTLLIVFSYLVVILCGVTIALHARDRFGMLLGFGLVVVIAIQAAVNIGVTTAVLPNKGLPLPFISYGGSNLVFCLLCLGILINIYRHGVSENGSSAPVRLRVRARPQRLVRI